MKTIYVARISDTKETQLEELYVKSDLRHSPDEPAIKQLLLDCLEEAWGDLSMVPKQDFNGVRILRSMQEVINRYLPGTSVEEFQQKTGYVE